MPKGNHMTAYFTAVFKGVPAPDLQAKNLSHGDHKCVGIAAGNAHAERCRLRDALDEARKFIESITDVKWEGTARRALAAIDKAMAEP